VSDERRFGRVLRLGSVRKDVDEELAYHFERTVAEVMAAGGARAEAEAEARRRFGDVTHYRSELEHIDRRTALHRRLRDRLDVARQSMVWAVRSVTRSPGLALGVVLAFALGIGANVTMYSVVERLLLRPPEHIVDAGAVKRVYVSEYVSFMGTRYTSSTLSYPDYVELRGTSGLADLAGWAPRDITVGHGLDAQERRAVYATGNLFDMLGVKPAHGRFFTAAEDRVGGPAQAILSWESWQRDYAGAADVLGRTIDFGYGGYEVIGVAPRGFTGVDLGAVDLWLPFHVVMEHTSGTEWHDSRGWQRRCRSRCSRTCHATSTATSRSAASISVSSWRCASASATRSARAARRSSRASKWATNRAAHRRTRSTSCSAASSALARSARSSRKGSTATW
jgi:hypothetical protein